MLSQVRHISVQHVVAVMFRAVDTLEHGQTNIAGTNASTEMNITFSTNSYNFSHFMDIDLEDKGDMFASNWKITQIYFSSFTNTPE